MTLHLVLIFLAASCAAAPQAAAAFRPYTALAELAPLLAQYRALPANSIPVADAVLLLTRAAETFSAARAYANVSALRTDIVALHSSSPASPAQAQALLLARIALSEALTAERRFAEALEVLDAAGAAAEAQATAPSSRLLAAALLRSRAQVLDCSGDSAQAVSTFERGLPALPWPTEPLSTPASVRLAKSYLLLLRRAGRGGTPAAARLEAALLARGPWSRADQLPRSFHPQLSSQPFYNASSPPWGLGALVAALSASTPALLAEYRALEAQALLLTEAECINDPASGVWRYFTVNAPWVEHVDQDGCSTHTPSACALLARARAEDWGGAALRGTFSSVAGGGVLKPHCGLTNAQVKLHLGLQVPVQAAVAEGGGVSARPAPCAVLTVAGETRAWEEGGVLMFDDSFEHSVVNSCQGAERVVFQLVLPHGEARGGAWDDKFVSSD